MAAAPDHPPELDRMIEVAMQGGGGAAPLTQRLLAFSRRQPLAPKPLELNKLVAGLSDLLGRTPGETIRIETVPGTGLGLSQVYGFIKQSGGHVNIYSEPNEGTAVKIYLQRLTAVEEDHPNTGSSRSIPRGQLTECILVVEDEDSVRTLSAGIIANLGYAVLQAADGSSASAIMDAIRASGRSSPMSTWRTGCACPTRQADGLRVWYLIDGAR